MHSRRTEKIGAASVVARAALLDLDGTLVDTNYQHALAWYRAFRAVRDRPPGVAAPPPHRDGRRPVRRRGRRRRRRATARRRPPRRARRGVPAAPRRVRAARRRPRPARGAEASAASQSCSRARRARTISSSSSTSSRRATSSTSGRARTTSSARSRTPTRSRRRSRRPARDDAVMLGDSRWDIEAAAKAGLPTICVLTGGWSEQELRDHGAAAVFESIPQLARAPRRDAARLTAGLPCRRARWR